MIVLIANGPYYPSAILCPLQEGLGAPASVLFIYVLILLLSVIRLPLLMFCCYHSNLHEQACRWHWTAFSQFFRELGGRMGP